MRAGRIVRCVKIILTFVAIEIENYDKIGRLKIV